MEQTLKPNLRGTLKFIIAVLAVTLVLLVSFLCARLPINAWLEQYEQQQPKYTAQQVMDLLFQDPDWADIYDLAGIQSTKFEGRNEYVRYMEAKVGSSPLHFVETPAGLTGEYRYSVRLGDEEVAAFTLKEKQNDAGEFAGWELCSIFAYFTRQQSVTIQSIPGYTVYINGVPLDDSYTTVTAGTLAENYLPEGVHGYRYQQQLVTDLLVAPEILVLDEYNILAPVTLDEATGIYTVPLKLSDPITPQEEALILEAAKADALYSVRGLSLTELRKHFHTTSDIYKEICDTPPLLENGAEFVFDDGATVVKDFYKYSSKLFSVRVILKLNVTDWDGNVTPLEWEYTYFFSPNNANQFLVSDRLEENLQQLIVTKP